MKLLIAVLLTFSISLEAALIMHPESNLDVGVINFEEEGPMKPAIRAFQNGEYEEAYKIANALAQENDPGAFFLLGYAAEKGVGVEQSVEKALDYYAKAIKLGHKDALYRRALILLTSSEEPKRQLGRKALEGVAKKDKGVANRILGEAWLRGVLSAKPAPDKVIKSWSAALKAGDSDSLILLARMRSGEFGFPGYTDPQKAIQLYKEAAEGGDERAFLPLGSLFLNRDESLRNEVDGRIWLTKAIGLKQTDAYLILGEYEQYVKKDDKAAFASYLKGANAGQLECVYRTGICFYTGKGIHLDNSKGLEWLNKAADGGHANAAFELSSLISSEKEPDYTAMYSRLVVAAEGGLAKGMNELGLLYLSGNLGCVDKKAALSWFNDASKEGYAPSQHNLGILYERGMGVEVNFQNAGELYTLAANQGHTEATMALARLHIQGKGVKQNAPKAWALAKLAKDRGDRQANKLIYQIEKILTPESRVQGEKIYKDFSKK